MRAIVLAIGVLGVAIVLLCVGVILRKDHAFRSQHIGDNERMKADNIHCAAAQDRQERKRSQLKIEDWKLKIEKLRIISPKRPKK